MEDINYAGLPLMVFDAELWAVDVENHIVSSAKFLEMSSCLLTIIGLSARYQELPDRPFFPPAPYLAIRPGQC